MLYNRKNVFLFTSENTKIPKPGAWSRTACEEDWLPARMDSVPYFGLARWLFCLEDMVPMGVAGLLSSPCLGTVEYTVWGKLVTQPSNGECLWTPFHVWLGAKAKASTPGPEISVTLGVKEKSLFFLQGLIGQLNPCWNSQTLPCIRIQPRQLLALEGVCQHLIRTPYCQGLSIQALKKTRAELELGTHGHRQEVKFLCKIGKTSVWPFLKECEQGRCRALCWLGCKANLTGRASVASIAVLMSLASALWLGPATSGSLEKEKKKVEKKTRIGLCFQT